MANTEFYCQTTADNLNAGSTTADGAVYTSAAGDSDGTSVFTPNDGSTPASSVTAGDWGSVYVTAGATVATFVGRITTVAAGVNGAITFSTTAKSGTFPAASAGAHTITCKTGGAWKGPNGTVNFPFGFVTAAQTNAAGDIPRVNFKNGVNYAVTAAVAHSLAGPARFEGYTSSAGDGGRAVLDGGTSGASYVVLTISGADNVMAYLTVQNNGATGNATLVGSSAARLHWFGCVFSNSRGHGVSTGGGSNQTLEECEAFLCNASNSASLAGFQVTVATSLVRCVSHDNAGSNSRGFQCSSFSTMSNCVADTNGGPGFGTTSNVSLIGCDAYNNGSDGLLVALGSASVIDVESSNFVKNGGYGINNTGAGTRVGFIRNCGFGSGTQTNTSGQTTATGGVEVSGSITYATDVTPWVDPANGDFRVNLAAAQGTGRGTFTQTASSYAGAVGYPDVGSCQHRDNQPVINKNVTYFLVDP